MDKREASLKTLRAKPLDELLDELLDYRRRADAGEDIRQPLLTVYLRTGGNVGGYLLDLSESRRQPSRSVLMRSGGGDGRPQDDVLYFPVSSIEAIRVHDVTSLQQASVGIEARTPLQLKRILTALEAHLTERVGKPVVCELRGQAFEDAALQVLTDLIDGAKGALEAMVTDEMARNALREKVSKVAFAVAEASAVTLDAGTLLLETASVWPRRLTARSLKAQLEATLERSREGKG